MLPLVHRRQQQQQQQPLKIHTLSITCRDLADDHLELSKTVVDIEKNTTKEVLVGDAVLYFHSDSDEAVAAAKTE